jgi:hypothetical protein
MVLAASAFLPPIAEAQTRVVLDAPKTEAIDTMVRGGSYARTNFDRKELMTRASDYNEYIRRSLLKFNTEKYVPAKAVITSATLTLTVKEGNPETRRLSAYRVVQSFDAPATTWKKRNGDSSWKKAGGDIGKKYAEATVTAKVGSKVTFDVTKLVQEAVNGNFGSRWTRIAVIDGGQSSRSSYKVYYASEASASVRPATCSSEAERRDAPAAAAKPTARASVRPRIRKNDAAAALEPLSRPEREEEVGVRTADGGDREGEARHHLAERSRKVQLVLREHRSGEGTRRIPHGEDRHALVPVHACCEWLHEGNRQRPPCTLASWSMAGL